MPWLRPLTFAAILVFTASPALAQGRSCSGPLSPLEEARRGEGLMAVRIINTALVPTVGLNRSTAPYPTWEELADEPSTKSFTAHGKAMRDVAMQMRWGTPEPLPGWRIHYVAGRDTGYAFTLKDVTDNCGFGYASDDTGVISELRSLTRQPRMVPLGSQE